jgi:hypothetical protein
MSLRRVEEDLSNEGNRSREDNQKVESSMIVSKSILNKFQTPIKEDLKMVKEEHTITTDSEMEEYQKSVNKFKSKKPTPSKAKFIGDNLGFNKTETSYRHSK